MGQTNLFDYQFSSVTLNELAIERSLKHIVISSFSKIVKPINDKNPKGVRIAKTV